MTPWLFFSGPTLAPRVEEDSGITAMHTVGCLFRFLSSGAGRNSGFRQEGGSVANGEAWAGRHRFTPREDLWARVRGRAVCPAASQSLHFPMAGGTPSTRASPHGGDRPSQPCHPTSEARPRASPREEQSPLLFIPSSTPGFQSLSQTNAKLKGETSIISLCEG